MSKNNALSGAFNRLEKNPPHTIPDDIMAAMFENGKYGAFSWSHGTDSWPADD